MDTDPKIVTGIKKVIKNFLFFKSYYDTEILTYEDGNQAIKKIIDLGEPACVVRGGCC